MFLNSSFLAASAARFAAAEAAGSGSKNFCPIRFTLLWFHAVDSFEFLVRPEVHCLGIRLHLVDGKKMKVSGG